MNDTKEITNTQDLIDSRDIIERIDYLESLDEDIDEDEKGELAELKALAEECEGGDWEYGVDLIHEDHFEDYARDFAEDIGAIGKDTQWPVYCIDWERAARELKMDYTQVDFDGATYYYR